MALMVALFACVGVGLEVLWTAALDYPKYRSWRLLGHSYVWMFPIYGLIPLFLSVLYPRLAGLPLALRLAAYTAILMAVEYASGWTLQKTTGGCPWEPEYRGKRWAVHGLVRLDYAPAWALACFLFERLYLSLLRL